MVRDRHSRWVAILKVVLPLAALAILSTLFLLSRSIDPVSTIPFSQSDIEERLREPQVTLPFFSGVTDRGDQILLTADVARPGQSGGPASAEALSARIELLDGGRLALRAGMGRADFAAQEVAFSDAVELTSSTGYTVTSDRLVSALDVLSIESPGPVEGEGPIGQISAGAMEITSDKPGGGTHILFKDGVKLVYDPKAAER